MDITKVIIPAAGTGERFFPYSKSVPREMLPVGRKPALQHIVEEALASELANIILISSPQRAMLLNHFDPDYLERALKESVNPEQLTALKKLSTTAHFTMIPQPDPLGTAHAIWLARHCIGKEYFGVAFPDDLIFGKIPALSQIARIARQEKATVIAVQEVPADSISSYGVIGIKKTITPNLFQVASLVEKPHQKDAPSSLAIVGRYIISSKIIPIIDSMMAYDEQQISLTDALTNLLHNNERIFAYKVQGTRHDIGTQAGWVKAVVGTSFHDPEVAPALRAYLAESSENSEHLFYKPARPVQENL